MRQLVAAADPIDRRPRRALTTRPPPRMNTDSPRPGGANAGDSPVVVLVASETKPSPRVRHHTRSYATGVAGGETFYPSWAATHAPRDPPQHFYAHAPGTRSRLALGKHSAGDRLRPLSVLERTTATATIRRLTSGRLGQVPGDCFRQTGLSRARARYATRAVVIDTSAVPVSTRALLETGGRGRFLLISQRSVSAYGS